MDATPFEQVLVVAVATYWTGELTVAPFAGLLTVTLANAGVASVTRINVAMKKFSKIVPSGTCFIPRFLPWTNQRCLGFVLFQCMPIANLPATTHRYKTTTYRRGRIPAV
jgi:hypothetical protein